MDDELQDKPESDGINANLDSITNLHGAFNKVIEEGSGDISPDPNSSSKRKRSNRKKNKVNNEQELPSFYAKEKEQLVRDAKEPLTNNIESTPRAASSGEFKRKPKMRAEAAKLNLPAVIEKKSTALVKQENHNLPMVAAMAAMGPVAGDISENTSSIAGLLEKTKNPSTLSGGAGGGNSGGGGTVGGARMSDDGSGGTGMLHPIEAAKEQEGEKQKQQTVTNQWTLIFKDIQSNVRDIREFLEKMSGGIGGGKGRGDVHTPNIPKDEKNDLFSNLIKGLEGLATMLGILAAIKFGDLAGGLRILIDNIANFPKTLRDAANTIKGITNELSKLLPGGRVTEAAVEGAEKTGSGILNDVGGAFRKVTDIPGVIGRNLGKLGGGNLGKIGNVIKRAAGGLGRVGGGALRLGTNLAGKAAGAAWSLPKGLLERGGRGIGLAVATESLYHGYQAEQNFVAGKKWKAGAEALKSGSAFLQTKAGMRASGAIGGGVGALVGGTTGGIVGALIPGADATGVSEVAGVAIGRQIGGGVGNVAGQIGGQILSIGMNRTGTVMENFDDPKSREQFQKKGGFLNLEADKKLFTLWHNDPKSKGLFGGLFGIGKGLGWNNDDDNPWADNAPAKLTHQMQKSNQPNSPHHNQVPTNAAAHSNVQVTYNFNMHNPVIKDEKDVKKLLRETVVRMNKNQTQKNKNLEGYSNLGNYNQIQDDAIKLGGLG